MRVIVISNSSALINLVIIGRLDLLREKFGEIIVPQAVWQEVVIEGAGKPGAKEVERANWIRVEEVTNKPLVQLLEQKLDDGESEAIALALEVGADLVLLDERDARDTAESLGLDILGVIGILIWAKKKGLILSLQDELDQLRNVAKFRFNDKLYRRVLAEVGEVSGKQ
ncbi:DUF3368 domain-containing protein [candidate division KSB1 bacterium]|nr:MAG: DUF3368 domain-containing protein [candidate division KSB1 bacterium]